MKSLKKIKKLPWPVTPLLVWLFRLWAKTLRLTITDPVGVFDGRWEKPTVYVQWHNRLVLMPALVPAKVLRRVSFLASASRDGAYVVDYLTRFELSAVRGSSSRGGAGALRELKAALETGRSVMLTPDGPRGPRYEMQEGAFWLAEQTGAPIIPVGVNAARRWELKSWDQTQFPKPFSRVELVAGEPIAPEADSEAWHAKVHEACMAITNDSRK